MNNCMKTKIAFIGDLTVDIYPELGKTYLGGTSLNSAIWAKRAGAQHISILAAVGDDTFGNQYLKKVQEEGIDSESIKVFHGKTSTIKIFIDANGQHGWGTWNAGVLEHYHLTSKEFKILQNQNAAVLSVYRKTQHLLSEFTEWGKEQEKPPLRVVNFDDLSQFNSSPEIVAKHIQSIDIAFFGLDREKDISLLNNIQRISRQTGKLMVVTLGKNGSIAFDGQSPYITVPAEYVDPKRIMDTTGAGDAFLAAFIIFYLTTNRDIAVSLAAGNHFGAKKIQIIGAY